MKDFQYALFDFDGTLVDSQWFFRTIMPRLFMERGYEIPEEEIEECLDLGWLDKHDVYRERFGVKEPLFRHYSELFEYVDRFYQNELFWKPGAEEYLRELRKQGKRIALFTATPEKIVRRGLEHLGGIEFFDSVFSVETIGLKKNNPDSFRYCLNAMGATVENTVLFEDALYSIRTAKSIGMTVYAVRERCSRLEEAEIRALADRYAIKMTEFLDDEKSL